MRACFQRGAVYLHVKCMHCQKDVTFVTTGSDEVPGLDIETSKPVCESFPF